MVSDRAGGVKSQNQTAFFLAGEEGLNARKGSA
jgi:hypothetical protein